MPWSQETLTLGLTDELEQPAVVTVVVKQAAGLLVQPELRPRPHFEELVHRADAARQREERLGHLAHAQLALGHRRDDMQLTEASVPGLALDEHLRNHADHASASLECSVRQHAHE